jgi:hypothetical protein
VSGRQTDSVGATAIRIARRLRRLVRTGSVWLFGTVLGAVLVGNILFSTPRDVAYRAGHPDSAVCSDHPELGWSVLAEKGNDEQRVLAESQSQDKWQEKLQCAIQKHVILGVSGSASPIDATNTPTPRLQYYLAFLEFSETGDPYALQQATNVPPVQSPVSENTKPQGQPIGQLEALTNHLKVQKANYVIAFAHGWRHDASIGDGNVADLRVYAAHAARFLADRCDLAKTSPGIKDQYACEAVVTAVYVGWRGARVDEKKLTRWFGWIGEQWGSLAASLTLFDRKPVSEQVGPSVVTSLQEIDRALVKNPASRMIVFGHSLGGNLFASSLKDGFVKAVHRHKGGTKLTSPLGRLVVLINPASEAANWTVIQRAVWEQIAYKPSDEIAGSTILDGHQFFPRDQKPVMVSVTAARSWPPGGLRAEDCLALTKNEHSRALLKRSEEMAENGVEYDWATYDLFPLFKFDFRPAAGTLFRAAAKFAGDAAPENPCSSKRGQLFWRLLTRPLVFLASIMRNAPFMTTDQEQTHTIGNLDPPRPSVGNLTTYYLPARPFGTTHQLQGYESTGKEKTIDYASIATAQEAHCSNATNWLWRARDYLKKQNGTFWDSNNLEASDDPAFDGTAPAAEFTHGFTDAGISAITRANDPFWNMRAFDNALARHDGYMLSSFICAMNQLVLDEIATAPSTQAESTH